MFLTFIEGSMEVELMVTKRDDDRRRRRQGEYRAICLWKMDWQSFAIICFLCNSILEMFYTEKVGLCTACLAASCDKETSVVLFYIGGILPFFLEVTIPDKVQAFNFHPPEY